MRWWFAGVLLGAPTVAAAGTLKLDWKFTGIEDGYDHVNKMVVYVNGELVGESPSAPQSQRQKWSIDVPDGAFELRVVNHALYEGTWEEHTVANNYSVDCLLETSVSARSKHSFKLVFGLDDGVEVKGR